MKYVLLRHWSFAAIVAVSLHTLVASAGAAEVDHLKGYKTRDINQVPVPANPYTVGDETCDLRKPIYVLRASAKNNGDDPRSGPLTDFACYRARCTGGPFPATVQTTDADSQFGMHRLERRRTKIVCLPLDNQLCGDNELDPPEECDGSDDAACPGLCLPSCVCNVLCPDSGGDPLGCQRYVTSEFSICANCCTIVGGCPACATAAASSCINSAENDACGTELNTVGCSAACCY